MDGRLPGAAFLGTKSGLSVDSFALFRLTENVGLMSGNYFHGEPILRWLQNLKNI